MNKTITFKTEIEFRGSAEEFGKVAAALVELPIRIRVEWPPGHLAGCWPVLINEVINDSILDKITEGMPRISAKINQGIPGGIRDPHLHLRDEVVLLDKNRFKQLAGQVAQELTERLADKAGYTETVGAIRNLVPGAI
jgi:hypothetical protein